MRSIWRTLDGAAIRSIAVICLSVLVIGMSYGATAHDVGLVWWQALAIATVVLAGSSEFVFLGVLAAGGAPVLGAVAGLLVNSRNFGYGLAVGHHLPRGWRLLLGAHLINDESAAVASSEKDPVRARAAFFVCGAGVLITWPLGAVLGSGIGKLADPATLGLDAAFPALLVALAIPALRDRSTLGAVAIGAVAALATTPFLPAGLPILVGLVGVAVTEIWRSRRRPEIVDDDAARTPELV